MNQCKAVKPDGQQCRANAISESGLCRFHDPALAVERAEARRRGGLARHGRQIGETGSNPPVKLAGVSDVAALLERAVNDSLRLENSLARARTLGSLAAVLIRAFEVGELEQRIAALEVRVSQGLQPPLTAESEEK